MNSIVAFLTALGLLLPGWPAVNLAGGVPSGAAPTPVTQVFWGRSGDTFVDGTTEYMSPVSDDSNNIDGTENTKEIVMLAGTISEMRVLVTGNAGTNTTQITMRKCAAGGGACGDTTVDCTTPLSGGTTSCNSGADSFTVADGDRITMSVVTGSDVSNIVNPTWSFKWVGEASNESMVVLNYAGHASTTQCNGSTCANFGQRFPAPENFTITGMWVVSNTAIATGCRRLTLFGVFGGAGETANNALEVDLTSSATEGNDQTGSVTFNTGSTPDSLNIQDDPGTTCGAAGSATTAQIAATLRLESTGQRFMGFHCGGGSSSSTSANNFEWDTGSSQWNATETSRDVVSVGFDQTGFAFKGEDAPVVPESYFYAFRDDTASVGGCTVQDAATSCTCSSSCTGTIADGSLVDILSDPSAVVTAPVATDNWCASWSGTGF